MARTATLLQLRDRAFFLCDRKASASSSRRHTVTRVNELVNDAVQAYRDLLVAVMQESPYRAQPGAASSTVSGTASYALPSGSARVHGVELQTGNGDRIQLPYLQPSDALNWDKAETGEPRFWTFIDSGYVRFVPTPDGVYSFWTWYDPSLTDLSSDSDTFDPIVEGGVPWVAHHVALHIMTRDDDDELYAKVERNLARWDASVRRNALTFVKGSSHRKDTRSERLRADRGLRSRRMPS